MKAVRIGCSGWNYEHWRGDLYPRSVPKRRWLAAYAERLGTVEVNSTFYRLASLRAVEGWVRDTPDKFVFSVKASRYLTHVRRLTDLDQGIRRFYAPLAPLVGDHPDRPFHGGSRPATGGMSVCTMARADGTVTIRRPSWRRGRGGSPSGAPDARCTRISTTIGAATPLPTPSAWQRNCRNDPSSGRHSAGSPRAAVAGVEDGARSTGRRSARSSRDDGSRVSL